MPEEPKAPEEGQPQKEEAPKEPNQDFKIPEKFQGKSPEEIARAYVELSSTIGKQGEELGRTKKEKEELEKNIKNLEGFFNANPDLVEEIKKRATKKEEVKNEEPQGPSEERSFLTSKEVGDFEKKYGISTMDAEKAQELRGKIGKELQIMLDPYGTGEEVDKLIQKVPLTRLPGYFERAYKLATEGDSEEQARLRGIAEASQNANAMFGSIPSSSAKTNQTVLTEKEKEVARKLGVPEKEYGEYKAKQYNN